MREEEFKAWLAKNGASPGAGNTRCHAIRTIENNLAALGSLHPDLDAAWAADRFEQLRARIKEMRDDFEAGGEDFRILMPKSEYPRNRLTSWRSWLGQYGRSLNNESMDVTDADRIRQHVLETYIEPARADDRDVVEVLVSTVHDALGLSQAWANVCQALEGPKMQALADVDPPARIGAPRSPATIYRFDLTPMSTNWAEAELRRRYGAPVTDTEKMIGFALPDDRQVALQRDVQATSIWIEDNNTAHTCPVIIHRIYAADEPRHSNLPPRLKHMGSRDAVSSPVAIARPSDLAQLRKLLDWYEGQKSALNRRTLEQLRQQFIEKHPLFQSFEDAASFDETEGAYKRALIARAAELVELHGDDDALGGALLELATGKGGLFSNLIDWRAAGLVEEIRQAKPGLVEVAIATLARSVDPAEGVMGFVDEVWPSFIEGRASKPYAESRMVPTMIQALLQPDAMLGIRSTPTNNAHIMLCGRPVFGWNPLQRDELEATLSMAREIERIMAEEWGWAPRDLWDIQGFIWETCQKVLPTKANDSTPIWLVTARDGAADGFDGFIERGDWRLLYDNGSKYNDMVREMQPGDRIVLGNFLGGQQRHAPFDTRGYVVTAMRFRATGIVTETSEDGISVEVDWSPFPKPRMWWLYTNNDTIWRLPVDKSEFARSLAAFIFDGEEQDLNWFRNQPYWSDRFGDDATERLKMPDPTNLILYGPPGTGKTYKTARTAVELCDGVADYPDDEIGRAALMERYRMLQKQKRIGFVTFHQNFSYEDFVEGLRPVTGGETEAGPGFALRPEPGIFKEICALADQARKHPLEDAASSDSPDLSSRNFWKMSIGNSGSEDEIYQDAVNGNYIALGWASTEDWTDPRYGSVDAIKQQWLSQPRESSEPSNWSQTHRFRNVMQVGDIVIVPYGNSAFRAVGEVTGPYRYDSECDGYYANKRAVRWLVTLNEPLPLDTIVEGNFTMRSVYPLPSQRINFPALKRLIAPAAQADNAAPTNAPAEQFVLIIDEINRANISKVFGELITLIEPDKRLGMPNFLTVRLPYSKSEFGVPANLHIVGTMNTADRSIALLDTALRRRFTFRELSPRPDLLGTVGEIDLKALLTTINERIEYLIDREHRIGHAFFIGCKTDNDIDAAMRDKVIPLLQEYFFEDWSRIHAVLGSGFIGSRKLNAPPGIDGDMRESWFVRTSFAANAYQHLIKGSPSAEEPHADNDADEIGDEAGNEGETDAAE